MLLQTVLAKCIFRYASFLRSGDCLCVSVASGWRRCGFSDASVCHRAALFTYYGEVLRCPHKRIVTIMKVYIARNNIQWT